MSALRKAGALAGSGTPNDPYYLAVCGLGLDMVGPFKTARGGLTHLLVAIDKFTKWVEAKPIKKLYRATATKFIIEITIRFGIPHSIITDNGINFGSVSYQSFAADRKSDLTWHRWHTRNPMDG